jgi:hypothetical protein
LNSISPKRQRLPQARIRSSQPGYKILPYNNQENDEDEKPRKVGIPTLVVMEEQTYL